jgi:BirA family biotin operon repressor/biotin-[acetyl-CoA-carboxylase] ligase
MGNLNLSILLRPEPGPIQPGRWALLAGVALHDALAPFAPTATLKWPNDVLLDGAKLGGILIDSQMGADVEWVVIGIGVNLREAPQVEGRAATCLPPPAPAAKELAETIVARIDHWTMQDTAEITAAWLDRAHPIGTLLDVHLPQRRLTGLFAGLSPLGELLLTGHPDAIGSAEVFQ